MLWKAEMTIEYRPEDLKGAQRAVAAQIAKRGDSPSIVLSLEHLDDLDVPALRGLITLLREARSAGAELSLRTSSERIRRVLAVTALDRLFRIVDSKQAA